MAAVIRRSNAVSSHGDGRQLLYEPTMGCYLEKNAGGELRPNPCWQRIQNRWYIQQDGRVEYPVLERPVSVTASAAVLSVLFAGYTTLFMDSNSWSLALWWGAALLSVVMFIADPMGRIAKRFTPARHTTSR